MILDTIYGGKLMGNKNKKRQAKLAARIKSWSENKHFQSHTEAFKKPGSYKK
jgi:hypothetical protein